MIREQILAMNRYNGRLMSFSETIVKLDLRDHVVHEYKC